MIGHEYQHGALGLIYSLTMREIVSRCPSGEPGGTGNDGEGVADCGLPAQA